VNRREFIGALVAAPMLSVVQPKPMLDIGYFGDYGSFGADVAPTFLHGSHAVIGADSVQLKNLIWDLQVEYLDGLEP
jgi:hypothetical protein